MDDTEAIAEEQGKDEAEPSPAKRARKPRRTPLFPASTFEDALELALAIFKTGSGQPVRRVTLLDELGRSPSSGATRQLITNSSKYGLITGSYNAKALSLTSIWT